MVAVVAAGPARRQTVVQAVLAVTMELAEAAVAQAIAQAASSVVSAAQVRRAS